MNSPAIVLPESQIEPQSDQMVESALDIMYQQDANLRELEVAYPGLRDAVGAGMKPVIVKLGYKVLPLYRAELSAMYQTGLTSGEARAAAAFFRSPPMVRFIRSARTNMGYSATLGNLDPDKPITAADMQADMGTAGKKAAEAVSKEDQAAIQAFMFSPLGLKLGALRSRKLAIDTKWANYTDPESERAMTVAVEQAMIAHVALTDPETAELMRQELAKPAT